MGGWSDASSWPQPSLSSPLLSADAAPLICLDPGHARTPNLTTEPIGPGSTTRKIKDGGGASGEAPVVLAIGLKLRSLLLDRGYRVAMTRNGPTFTRGAGGNVDRAKFCNRQRAALMIRIHADGSSNPRTHGVSTLYPAWRRGWTSDIYRPSLRAARVVHRNVLRTTGAADRGLVARSDLTGFNWANVPVILVETGLHVEPHRAAEAPVAHVPVARCPGPRRRHRSVRPAVVTDGVVAAVCRSETHTMSKPVRESIVLVAGLGVDGDAHQGVRVKHRSRVRKDPTAPNLRQVHVMHAELHEELAAKGFPVSPGQLGENVTTRGVDLLGLPAGTRLHLGETAVVELTGLRNPCTQLDGIQDWADGRHARSRRGRRARAQGGRDGDRPGRRRGARRGSGPGGAAVRAASRARAGLSRLSGPRRAP